MLKEKQQLGREGDLSTYISQHKTLNKEEVSVITLFPKPSLC